MRALTPVEVEALLVRHEAAIRLRKQEALDAWEALEFVLLPSEDVLRVSMTVAEQTGAGTLAKQLAAKKIKRKPYGPRSWGQRQLVTPA